MCGRYTLIRLADFTDMFPWIRLPAAEQTPRFNIAPSQECPIVRVDKNGKACLSLARWGLIPSWTKGKPKIQPINAKAETASTSGMFRQAMELRRCLVPADGFYEWQGVKPPKQPYFIRMKDDKPFAFAGLWERWKPDAAAEPVDTFTILTTTPNELMRPIHNRMPVILDQRDYGKWMDRDKKAFEVAELLKPYDAGRMEAHAVGVKVNKPGNDDPTLIEPV